MPRSEPRPPDASPTNANDPHERDGEHQHGGRGALDRTGEVVAGDDREDQDSEVQEDAGDRGVVAGDLDDQGVGGEDGEGAGAGREHMGEARLGRAAPPASRGVRGDRCDGASAVGAVMDVLPPKESWRQVGRAATVASIHGDANRPPLARGSIATVVRRSGGGRRRRSCRRYRPFVLEVQVSADGEAGAREEAEEDADLAGCRSRRVDRSSLISDHLTNTNATTPPAISVTEPHATLPTLLGQLHVRRPSRMT